MKKIRVVVADDHAVLRGGLRLMINTQSDMEVVGEAGTFAETVGVMRRVEPDVVTLDLEMPGGTGIRLIETLVREFPQSRVLVLTMHDDPTHFRLAVAAGAAGYVTKKSADSELLTAIRTVADSRMYARMDLDSRPLPGRASGSESSVQTLDSLSEREREVFEMVARGHTSQAIADKLFLSVKTVESYRSRLMTKLGLQNRAELTQFAMDLGLLSHP
jgi:two-component system, NarL family, response regulator NreC